MLKLKRALLLILAANVVLFGAIPQPIFAASDGYFRNLYLDDNTQIQSFDPNHRILFRRGENKLELREYGSILFSPGATSGQETSKMVILSNGNVGVGTNSPLAKLDIKQTAGDWMDFVSANDGSRYRFHLPASGERLELGVYDGSSGITHWEVLKIIRNGDIYFGNGQAKVNVNGTLKARQIIVTNSWADYVFDNEYRLMALPNLANYILENKHLPDIPAASDIEKDGISVGEMQKNHMVKIEELTLYILQQQKEIDSLKADVQYLKSKVN